MIGARAPTTAPDGREAGRAAQLTEALQSRDVIGQAKGILIERRGATAEEASDVLRRTPQDLTIKIRDLARVVADRRAEL